MQPPSNIVEIYRSQGWNDTAAINADIAAGGWVGKVPQTGGGGGGGGGAVSREVGGIDTSQIPSAQQFVQEQFVGEDVALRDLLLTMRGREKPLDIYGRLETEAQLPEMRGAAKTLMGEVESIEDILRGIEPDVAARTRESLVTEAQRRGIVQAKAKPFLKRLGEFGTALGRIASRITVAEQGVATKVQLAMKGQQMELEPMELYFSVLTDRNARLLTGFSTDRQTKLDLLFDKLERQRELDDQDWELANKLAEEEREYTRTIQQAAAEAGASISGGESIEELLGLLGRSSAAEGELSPEEWSWAENWGW